MSPSSGKRQRRIKRRQGKRGDGDRSTDSSDDVLEGNARVDGSRRTSTGSMDDGSVPERKRFIFDYMGEDTCRGILTEGWKQAGEQMAAELKKAREKRIEARRMRAQGGDCARNEPASENISDLKDRIRQLERLVKLMKQKAAIQEQQTAVQEKINAQLMAMVLGED